MSLFSTIPLWAYLVIALLGLLIAGGLFVLAGRAGQRPDGNGTPAMLLAIVSLLLLVLAPIVLLLVAQPWSASTTASTNTSAPPMADGFGSYPQAPESPATPSGPGDGAWRVAFSGGGVTYGGEFRPTGGEGPMVVYYSVNNAQTFVRQSCRMEGDTDIRILCRDPVILDGPNTYTADTFDVRASGDQMTGTILMSDNSRVPATFTRGNDSHVPGRAWSDVGRPSPSSATPSNAQPPLTVVPPPLPAPGAQVGDLHSRLEAGAAALRARIPDRRGSTTLTGVDVVGTQLVLHMSIDADFGPAQWSMVDGGLQRNACTGTSASIIQAGGTVEYLLVDKAGERHTTRVFQCGSM